MMATLAQRKTAAAKKGWVTRRMMASLGDKDNEELLQLWSKYMNFPLGGQVRAEILRRMDRVQVTDGQLLELLQVAVDRGAALTDAGQETFYKIFSDGCPIAGTYSAPDIQKTGGKVWQRLKDVNRWLGVLARSRFGGDLRAVRYVGVPVEIVGRG